MTQTFDPFSEVPPERASDVPVSCAWALPRGSGGDWAPPEEGLLERFTWILRRRKWIVLQAVVIVALAAFLYSKHQPTQYTASAGLLFGNPTENVLPNGASATASELNPSGVAATNGSLVTLPVVAKYASDYTGGKISAAEILSSVSVSTSSTGSDVATVSAVSGSPQRAAQIANAYGNGYIEFRRVSDQSAFQASINRITNEYDALSPSDRPAQKVVSSRPRSRHSRMPKRSGHWKRSWSSRRLHRRRPRPPRLRATSSSACWWVSCLA